KLAMLFTPGKDYKFTPGSGLTDENGVFTAIVTTSKSPGDSVLAATTGALSDQDHVLGTAPKSKLGTATQSARPRTNWTFARFFLLGVLAVGLVAAGVFLSVRSMAT
ncbi:MAG TPA: hypothetical protein VGR61_07285, partial [Candidatus Dormibacteraeota bacterium]|nr:hypothetical protein [Candidatus Dormibacteraeota bacterium]